MPRVCTGCSHPDRKGLEAAIVSGRPKAEIARAWGLKPDAVHGHAKHIAPKVAKAAEKEGRTLAGILADAHRRVDIIAKRNMRAKNDEVALKALKEKRELAALEFGTKSKVEQTNRNPEPATKQEREAELVRLKEEIERELGESKGTMQ